MTDEELDAWRARRDEKAAQQRHFAELERLAYEQRVNPKKAAKAARVTQALLPRRVKVTPAKRLTPPTHCITCGREMWRSHEGAREGAIKYGGGGKCSTCYSRPYAAERAKSPESCVDCGRAMRHTNQRLEDYPGTVKHSGHGRCAMCSRRHGRDDVRRRDAAPEKCLDCDRPMRTSDQLLADAPGTVLHRGQGLCDTCTTKRKRKGTWIPKALVR
jgi:hypothetical protein